MITMTISKVERAILYLLHSRKEDQLINKKKDFTINYKKIHNILQLSDLRSQAVDLVEPITFWVSKGTTYFSDDVNEATKKLEGLGLIKRFGKGFYLTMNDAPHLDDSSLKYAIMAYSRCAEYSDKWFEKSIREEVSRKAVSKHNKSPKDIDTSLEEYWEVQKLMMEENPLKKSAPNFLKFSE